MWWRHKKNKARQLWGQEFSLVKEGLAEDQVVQFVNDLLSKYRAQLEEQERREPFSTLVSKRMLSDAERDATDLRLRAKAEAERLVAEAQQEAEKILGDTRRQAKESAEKEAQGILDTANQKAHLTETRALQMAHLFLIRVQEEIQRRLASETTEIYNRLLSSLQGLLATAQAVEVEWGSKKMEPWWGRPSELRDYQATLLDSLLPGQPDLEALPREEPGQEARARPEYAEESPAQMAMGRTQRLSPQRQEASPPGPPREEVRPQETRQPRPQAIEATAAEPPKEQVAPGVTRERPPEAEQAPHPVQPKAEALPDLAREPVPQGREASPSQRAREAFQESVVTQYEVRPPEEETSRPTAAPTAVTDSEGTPLYSGEVDLVILPPVSATRISGLYACLQSIPELKILRTAGSWDRGTVVTVILERPTSLTKLLSDIPAVQVTPGMPGDSRVKGLREKGKATQWVSIIFEAEDTAEETD